MARDEAEQQAMASERMVELREWAALPWAGAEMLAEALVEVERQQALTDMQREALHRANVLERAARLERDELRAALAAHEAREAALLAVVRAVAEAEFSRTLHGGGSLSEMSLMTWRNGEGPGIVAQARALLASAGEAETGEQATQGEE